MTFDFDKVINRSGTHSWKWEFNFENGKFSYVDQTKSKHGENRILPMAMADMDFACPPTVIEALKARAEHGIFGYSHPADSYFEAVNSWFFRRHGWGVEPDWITLTPGVVPALSMLVQTFIGPGDKVLVQGPVYNLFYWAIEKNGGQVVSNSLVYENGCYHMDFDDLAQKAADPALKMALLCSPHNPVGRVWTLNELSRFAEICLENDVLIVSDEIFCDLIYPDYSFTSVAKINDTVFQKSIICTSSSKTFNLAGLLLSNIIIQDEALRQQFSNTLLRNGLVPINAFSIVASEAAYNHGETWLAAVIDYLMDNYRFMQDYLAEHLPQLRIVPLEGTYLVWVDFRQLGLDAATRKRMILEEARLILEAGEIYGPEGEGFERFNIACPRSILQEALERLKMAIEKIA